MVKRDKITKISLVLILAFVGVTALLGSMGMLAAVYAASFKTRYVSVTTGDDKFPLNNDCSDKDYPCSTIQRAVNKADSGDAILVATGIYTDLHSYSVPSGYLTPPASGIITQIVYITKTITIRGGYAANFKNALPDPKKYPTTLAVGKVKGRVMVIAGYVSPTIYNLRLTGGDAACLQGGWGSYDAGGGVYVISATAAFYDNQIFENIAQDGGGVYLYRSNATLERNRVSTNTADYLGGGLTLRSSDATLSDNTVISNTAAYGGGGLYLNYSDATLSGNIIMSNTTAAYGGGLRLEWQSEATLNNNTIVSNIADSGGGLILNYSAPILNNNTIIANTADDGGGLYIENDSRPMLNRNIIMSNTAYYGGALYVKMSDATLTNTVIANNAASLAGSGLYLTWRSSARLWHTTLTRNQGGNGSGVYVTNNGTNYSQVALTNTILVSHTVGITVTAGNTATLESTLWYGNDRDWGGAGAIFTGTNNYWGDPCFELDGYHLLTDSLAVDKGINAGVTSDIDGHARNSLPDLGADEVAGGGVYLPIVMKNS